MITHSQLDMVLVCLRSPSRGVVAARFRGELGTPYDLECLSHFAIFVAQPGNC